MARNGLSADFMAADFVFGVQDLNVKISNLFFRCKLWGGNLFIADSHRPFNFEIWQNLL
jgi:hypothetical protein